MRDDLARIATLVLRGRIRLACATVLGLAAMAWASFVTPLPRLTYNRTNSVAVGWYRVDRLEHPAQLLQTALPVGSIVLVRMPAAAAVLAGQRGYLPTRVPLLKPVAARWPQQVCMDGPAVRIDGAVVATVLDADRAGRPLQAWRQCRRLRPGELFLLGAANPASFDSRYFGPVDVSAVIGVAHPLWLQAQ
ncbi:conjugation peptidase TraF. Serine peptidase. MEROPS family S26C [Pseudoxanthomonas sp. GM95]|uniref:S26 family signal peptidase n=1 Tax=Pseudoxanthomonas sp. GM95 TaxID=1881043 RepID=UPI0008BCB03D|nr:S26 family signal peptidase [Pseudoxanthomonas sp. GM95]SEL95290.1 conjugation peptidase TraF. Serine peptidase. MEROPS family S26C [Pseudoxanthomonas sp. GM95]